MSKYNHFEMCEKIFGQQCKWNEQKDAYEPYSRTDMWNKLIEQQEQITDLEAKLAESESELEKQKEKYDKLYGCYKKTSSEDLQDKYRLAEENEQLKQQLAEKEMEIEELRRIGDKGHLNDLLEDKRKENKILMKAIEQHNQDKISFAVERLEKVKEWCENHKFSDEYDYVIAYEPDEADASGCVDYFKEQIDNQIKQIKEGK